MPPRAFEYPHVWFPNKVLTLQESQSNGSFKKILLYINSRTLNPSITMFHLSKWSANATIQPILNIQIYIYIQYNIYICNTVYQRLRSTRPSALVGCSSGGFFFSGANLWSPAPWGVEPHASRDRWVGFGSRLCRSSSSLRKSGNTNTSYFMVVIWFILLQKPKPVGPSLCLCMFFFMLYVLIGHYRLPADIFSDYIVSIHF